MKITHTLEAGMSWVVSQGMAFQITEEEANRILLDNWDWPQNRWTKVEYACPHGIGHGQEVHGCDGCCVNDSFKRRIQNVKRSNRSKNNKSKTKKNRKA